MTVESMLDVARPEEVAVMAIIYTAVPDSGPVFCIDFAFCHFLQQQLCTRSMCTCTTTSQA